MVVVKPSVNEAWPRPPKSSQSCLHFLAVSQTPSLMGEGPKQGSLHAGRLQVRCSQAGGGLEEKVAPSWPSNEELRSTGMESKRAFVAEGTVRGQAGHFRSSQTGHKGGA